MGYDKSLGADIYNSDAKVIMVTQIESLPKLWISQRTVRK